VHALPSAPLQTQTQMGAASSSTRVAAAVQPPPPPTAAAAPTDGSQPKAQKPKRKLTDLSDW